MGRNLSVNRTPRKRDAGCLVRETAETDDCRKALVVENQPTKTQGQYLAFIVTYTKLNRRAPAEADFQRYFDVTPPSVHNMILTLERRGFIKRTPGRPRSIELLVPVHKVSPLD